MGITLKKENEVFNNKKCTIDVFFTGNVSRGLIFITGIFCMRYRKTKSANKPKIRYEFTTVSGSESGNNFLTIKKDPIPNPKKTTNM